MSVIDTLEVSLRELAQSDWPATNAALEHIFPTCIVALSNWVIFFSIAEEKIVTLRLFELGKLSAACAMGDLFAALRRWSGGDVTGDLDRLIESLSIPTPIVRKIDLGVR